MFIDQYICFTLSVAFSEKNREFTINAPKSRIKNIYVLFINASQKAYTIMLILPNIARDLGKTTQISNRSLRKFTHMLSLKEKLSFCI